MYEWLMCCLCIIVCCLYVTVFAVSCHNCIIILLFVCHFCSILCLWNKKYCFDFARFSEWMLHLFVIFMCFFFNYSGLTNSIIWVNCCLYIFSIVQNLIQIYWITIRCTGFFFFKKRTINWAFALFLWMEVTISGGWTKHLKSLTTNNSK